MENDQSREGAYVINRVQDEGRHDAWLPALMIETVCLALISLHGFGTHGFLLATYEYVGMWLDS